MVHQPADRRIRGVHESAVEVQAHNPAALGDCAQLIICEIARVVADGAGVAKVLKNTQPYSHGEVAQILCELDRKVKEGSLKLSRVENERFRQLLLAFSEDLQAMGYSLASNAKRTHLFQTQGEKHRFSVDFGMGGNIISRKQEIEESKAGYATLFRPTATGQIRDDS